MSTAARIWRRCPWSLNHRWQGAALLFGGLLLTGVFAAQRVRACATCACGDPTLTAMGTAQPFEHRLRLSLELQHRTDAVGREGVDRVELSEQRAGLTVAYAPARWLMLSLGMPVIRRELTRPSLRRDILVGPGDLELRARAFVFKDADFAARHLLAVVAGLRFPSAPLDRETGAYLDPELQPGSGSFDPIAGISYAHFADPWSFYVSEVVYIPTDSRGGWRQGTSFRGTHTLQYQFDPAWAARLGINTRLEEATRLAGMDEPDTGGFVAFVSPSLLLSPATDLILALDVHIPVINALTGIHDEGIIFVLGSAYDL